jgi:hypothetical protein
MVALLLIVVPAWILIIASNYVTLLFEGGYLMGGIHVFPKYFIVTGVIACIVIVIVGVECLPIYWYFHDKENGIRDKPPILFVTAYELIVSMGFAILSVVLFFALEIFSLRP